MPNSLDPAVLFFVFGIFAGLVKSNLEIPQPISRFLSLYLLMALGLKGGFALNRSGFTQEIALSLFVAVFLASLIPLLGYWFLSLRLPRREAAAIAATYGSVSAVTFITATQVLDQAGVPFGGHMAAAMALMESPAIILAIMLANKARDVDDGSSTPLRTSGIFRESFTDGAQLLLIGSMLIGILVGEIGEKLMAPFSIDLFKGMLAFFLLDMGLAAARNLSGLRGKPLITIVYALVAPLVHAGIALLVCRLTGLPTGDSVLLMVLAASASYIAVPAVLRHALPEVSPALYMGMSLGITFPFNLIIGIPLYLYVFKLTS